ncbi:MAG: DUF3267 domain-containing protein [Planctomycetota bacterium]|jgi:hypothetical protein
MEAIDDPPPAESTEPRAGRKVAEVRISKLAAVLVALPVAGVLVGGAVLLAWALAGPLEPRPSDAWQYALFLVFGTVVHELLHGWAIRRWGEVPAGVVKFGFHWKGLMPYCRCRVPVRLAAYRAATLFPLRVTAPVSLLALLAFPSLGVAAGGGVAVAGCVGDVLTFAKLRRFDGNCLVVDHPSEIGCDVFAPGSQAEECDGEG